MSSPGSVSRTCDSGRVTLKLKVLPCPGVLRTVMSPPISRAR